MKLLNKYKFKYFLFILSLIVALPALYFISQKIKPSFHAPKVHLTNGMFEVHHWVTPEGSKVAFTPLHELPILDIHLVFAAGSAFDGEKFGTAQLVQQLIGEDTTDLTGEALHEAFDSVGAQFDVGVSQDMMNISLRTLTDKESLEPAIDTLATILQKTTFTQPVFEREKIRLLTTIQSNKQDPKTIISQAYFKDLYGDHPYGHPITGTTDTVKALTLKDIQDFYQAHFVKQNAVLVIAGDLSEEAAKKLADKLIAALPSGQAAASIPAIPQITSHTTDLKFPSSQTHIMLGLPTIAKGNPDYFALVVGNQILGVTPLVNRLFQVVREDNGLAYNVGSSITTMKEPGPFTIYLQSRANESAKAESLVHETLKSYLQTGPSEEELKNAKVNLNGQFILGLSNNSAIAAHLATLAFYNLPWDYQDHFQEKVNAVTLDDIKTVFAKYIHPDKFSAVRLGENQ